MNCNLFDECGRAAYAKGLCLMHYKRQWRKTPKGKEAAKRDYQRQISDPERLETRRTAMQRWDAANRAKRRVIDQRRRARLLNVYSSDDTEWDRAWCLFWMPRCVKCGSTDRLEIDHIMPVSRGGGNCFDNFQTLCKPCNSGKRNRYADHRPILHKNVKWLDYVTVGGARIGALDA